MQPDEAKFSGVVFKIQANMDPAHRDRIAFVRVASGHFERGMRLKVVRSGKELRPNSVVSFLSQRRELLDEAYAGDIIGIPNHGVLQLGDTLTEGEALQFTGLPFFAPEMFRSVEVADPLRTKQLKAGLTQLGEEGAIQVFRPLAGSLLLLGAVGQLQFEVVAHRLEHEYGVKARILPSRYQVARWVTCDAADGGAKELQRFIDANAHRVAYDAVDAPTVLVEYAPELRAIESQLAEDQVPRAARARRPGVPAAAGGLRQHGRPPRLGVDQPGAVRPAPPRRATRALRPAGLPSPRPRTAWTASGRSAPAGRARGRARNPTRRRPRSPAKPRAGAAPDRCRSCRAG